MKGLGEQPKYLLRSNLLNKCDAIHSEMPEPMKYMESIGSGHTVTSMYHVTLILFFKKYIYSLKGPLQKSQQQIILERRGKELCSLHFLIC